MTALENSRSCGWRERLARGFSLLTPLNAWRKKHYRMLTSFVIFVSHLAGALALLETRTSQGTIAWVVSLNTFPYLAVPAYWVFGRSKWNRISPIRVWSLPRRSTLKVSGHVWPSESPA